MMLFLTVPDSEALGVADLPAWSYAHKPMVDTGHCPTIFSNERVGHHRHHGMRSSLLHVVIW